VIICKPALTWEYIKQASLPHLAGALLLYLASMLIVAWRWQLLLRVKNMPVGLGRLTRYYLVGFFFNNFMPSSIGGDITRILNVSSHGHTISESFSCVFVERLVGFLAMAVLSIGALLFLASHFRDAAIVIILTIGLAAAFAVLAWSCFDPRASRLITSVLARLHWKRLGDKLNRVYAAVHAYRHHAGTLWLVFAVSLFYQFVLGVFVFWVARATGLQASFWMMFALMQITSMAGIIPITLETAGVREFIFVLVLVPLGYDKSLVAAALLLVRTLSIIGSSLGGLFLLSGDMHIKRRTDIAEELL
jgi:uncharacterized protein (TIRG00374 family)